MSFIFKAECDGCRFVSGDFYSEAALRAYMRLDGKDGRWFIGRRLIICRGCIIDRACRIFGHQIVRQPTVLGGRTACTRCQTFQEPEPVMEVVDLVAALRAPVEAAKARRSLAERCVKCGWPTTHGVCGQCGRFHPHTCSECRDDEDES